ncbi:hypothetical protein MP228_010282 [Amoeboaphelidium protococcarum]|nr:hypothetical protein MP228_010282 [Amoeboaphelidium protococcarum]
MSNEHDHFYEDGEEVVVWANTVGPYDNRQETYEYFQLPYCQGEKEPQHHHETLGEALLGMELVSTGMEIGFRRNAEKRPICEDYELNSRQITLFQYAISNNYFFQYFIDDLYVGGYVGESDVGDDGLYLYTHQSFEFHYNEDRIIGVSLQMANPVLLGQELDSIKLNFTYSVVWTETSVEFKDRFDFYLDTEFFEHQIHWFAIANSFMMVLFLIAFVVVILMRALRMDYARYDRLSGGSDGRNISNNISPPYHSSTSTNNNYSNAVGQSYSGRFGDEELMDFSEDYGWKLVHGDVFRRPEKLSLLSASIGTGYQLNVMCVLISILALVGNMYTERASILTGCIFIFAATSFISGYYSAQFFVGYGGRRWIRTLMLSASLWSGAVCVITIIVNFIAIYYHSTKAIPAGTMVAIFCIWAFMVFPLTLLGTIVGKNWTRKFSFPTRVNPIPRPVPERQWYNEPGFLIFVGGILPFGSIFIEVYFVFTSFWTYKVYYVFGFLLLVIANLWIVTACVSIVVTYYLLNSEDWRWQWVSFLTGGSVSLYILMYSIYYFFAMTKMYGLFQTAFYFGYTSVLCLGVFLMCGSIGYSAASAFVRRIYATVKID